MDEPADDVGGTSGDDVGGTALNVGGTAPEDASGLSLIDLIRLAKPIPPGAWIERTKFHGNVYLRWRRWIDRDAGKKEYVEYIAPLIPKRTDRHYDEAKERARRRNT